MMEQQKCHGYDESKLYILPSIHETAATTKGLSQ